MKIFIRLLFLALLLLNAAAFCLWESPVQIVVGVWLIGQYALAEAQLH